MEEQVLLSTDFKNLKLHKHGKVRDVYDLEDKLLIVSTDRISCFDVVLNNGIPYKGKVLTGLSCFWFEFLKDIISHHFLTSDINGYPKELQKYKATLLGRSMLVKKTKPILIECVVRGYLSGSAWKEYSKTQSVCGIKLPSGLLESDKLPEILFTPSTKACFGHDMNVNQEYVEDLIGRNNADKIKDTSIKVYKEAASYALSRGVIIADTKFEFGICNNELILIDEALTPDSSRFWPEDQYQPGAAVPSFDKQFVRDYLEGLNWDKNPPAPELPGEIIQKTSQKYLQVYESLVGSKLKDTQDT